MAISAGAGGGDVAGSADYRSSDDDGDAFGEADAGERESDDGDDIGPSGADLLLSMQQVQTQYSEAVQR